MTDDKGEVQKQQNRIHFMFVSYLQNLSPSLKVGILHHFKLDKATTSIADSLHYLYCQARPQTQIPIAQPQPSQIQSKSIPKGLGLTLKSYKPVQVKNIRWTA